MENIDKQALIAKDPSNKLSLISEEVSELIHVDSLYSDLLTKITHFSDKLANSFQKQEDQFIEKYDDHIKHMALHVSKLKRQLKESEEKLSKDARVTTLASERDWFKKESIRLDSMVQCLKQENAHLRSKAMTADEEIVWLKKELRKGKMCVNTSESPKLSNSATMDHLKGDDESKRKEKDQMVLAESKRPKTSSSVERPIPKRVEITGSECATSTQALSRLSKQLKEEKKKSNSLEAMLVDRAKHHLDLLKDFSDCLSEVRNEAKTRRLKSIKQKTKLQEDDYFREFYKMKFINNEVLSAIEKRNIIERFFFKESVFQFISSKIFPSNGVKQSLGNVFESHEIENNSS